MEHLALYRKWRPQTFDALVGQEDSAKILKTAIATGKHGHAYLFCGTRGTGKTSTARIFAKAVNCENPKDGEPCNHCHTCNAITEGRSLDVIEIDAASNRGIDEIRSLLEKVHFVPAQSPYKVYIIDEVHMLTAEAFNALLKTLEEPPNHVIFILATTEARKVPMTILSRCQRFDFKPISEQKIFAALKEIAEKEHPNITDDAIEFLAQKAKGSMRDALSLMDQGLGSEDETLTAASFGRIIGSVATELWPTFLRDLARGDVAAVFSHIENVAAQGKDMRVFFQDLQQVLGDLLCYSGDLGQSYGKALSLSKGLLSDGEIISVLTILGESESAFRYQRDAKMVSRFLMAKIMRTLGEKTAPEKTEPSVGTEQRAAEKIVNPSKIEEPIKNDIPSVVSSVAAEKSSEESTKETPVPYRRQEDDDDSEAVWSQILQQVREKSPKTFTWLSKGNPKPLKNHCFTVEYFSGDTMYQSRMALPEHTEVLKQVLNEVFGREIAVKIVSDSNNESEQSSLFEI